MNVSHRVDIVKTLANSNIHRTESRIIRRNPDLAEMSFDAFFFRFLSEAFFVGSDRQKRTTVLVHETLLRLASPLSAYFPISKTR